MHSIDYEHLFTNDEVIQKRPEIVLSEDPFCIPRSSDPIEVYRPPMDAWHILESGERHLPKQFILDLTEESFNDRSTNENNNRRDRGTETVPIKRGHLDFVLNPIHKRPRSTEARINDRSVNIRNISQEGSVKSNAQLVYNNQENLKVISNKRVNKVDNRAYFSIRQWWQEVPKAISCGCVAGCQNARCACVKNAAGCGFSCKCSTCKNPFKEMESIGIDIHLLRGDICLMHKLSRKKVDMRPLLSSETRTSCCQQVVTVKDCLAGYTCRKCRRQHTYSWCTHRLHDIHEAPVLHCRFCKQCYEPDSVDICCPCTKKKIV